MKFSTKMMKHSSFFAASVLLAQLASAGIPELDIVFYGRVLHLGGGEEYLMTEGNLQWSVSPPEGSTQELFEASTLLEPLNGNTMSYHIRIPWHQAVDDTLPAVLSGLVQEESEDEDGIPFRNTSITLDGTPLHFADPAGIGFTAVRGTYRRLDLVYTGELPDADGDDIPDWWEEKYGTGKDVSNASADPDDDDVNNYDEYIAGTDPTGDDQEPRIASEILISLPVGGSAMPMLKATDSDSGAERLTFTVGALPAGISLQRIDTASPVSSFTQADVDAGRIQITHTGEEADQLSIPLVLRDETAGHAPVNTSLLLSVAEPALLWEGWGLPAEALPDTMLLVQDGSRLSGGTTFRAPSGPTTLTGNLPQVVPEDIARLFIGSSAADTFLASAKDDWIIPGAGDVVRSGAGADRILFASAAETVRVVDFAPEEGDVLDFRGLLELDATRTLGDYFVLNGSNVLVDANGDGSGFDDLTVELSGSDLPVEIADLWDAGHLDAGALAPVTTLFLAVNGSPSEEDLQEATVTLRRRGDATEALDVPLTWSGTAIGGADYLNLPSVARFAAGEKVLTFTVVPLTDDIREPTETIQVEVAAHEDWVIADGSRTATLDLADLPSRVWLEVSERIAYKSGLVPAEILVRRKGPLSGRLTVSLSTSGRAFAALDYSRLPSSVTFEAAETVIALDVTPLPSANLRNGAEDVVVTVQEDADYLLGSTPRARALILDGPQSAYGWMQAHSIGGDEREFFSRDSDGDGFNGLYEFAFGGEPEQSDSQAMQLKLLLGEDGRRGVRMRRWPSAPELQYILEESTDLSRWDAVEAEKCEETDHEILGNGIEQVDVYMDENPSNAVRFYRVRALYLN